MSDASPLDRCADDGGLPVIPGYDVYKVLGRGAYAVVYLARQQGLDRLVALKVLLSPNLLTPDARRRFLREARALARVPHPNILRIHDLGEHAGWPFLSLELAAGGSLADRPRDPPWPLRDAADLVRQLADAMHAAHQAGIIHRDLKPANVLLTNEGLPKICDFGLARDLHDASTQTQSGAIVGTPHYLAPEQAAGRSRHVGPAADIHALGAIFYELLTGRPPFGGNTTLDTLVQVARAAAAPPSKHRPDVPAALDVICLTCLEKAPADRYASSQELADDLRRFLAGQPVRRRRRRFRRLPLLAGALVAAALLLVLALVLTCRPALNVEQAWSNLSSGNDEDVRAAVNLLLLHPGQTLAMVEERLRPADMPRSEITPALANLELADAEARRLAEAALRRLSPGAEAALLDARGKGDRARCDCIESLLRDLDRARPAWQSQLFERAVDLVDELNTPEAVDLLRELTKPDRPLLVQKRAATALKRRDPGNQP